MSQQVVRYTRLADDRQRASRSGSRWLLRHKIDSCHKVHVAHRWWSPCGAGVGRFEAPLRGGFCAEPFEQLADLGLTKLASKDGARRRSPRPDPAATGPMPVARRNRGSAGARSAPRTVHPAGTRPPIVRAHPNHSYAEYSLGLPHLWLYRPGPPLPATTGNPRSHVSEAPATTPYRLVEPRRTGDLRELTRSGSARAAYGCRTLSDRGRSTPAGGVPRLRWWCRRRVRGGRRSAAAASGACR